MRILSFPHKYFVYVDFKKPFRASQQVEAFEWALGESGVYSNFLKAGRCQVQHPY